MWREIAQDFMALIVFLSLLCAVAVLSATGKAVPEVMVDKDIWMLAIVGVIGQEVLKSVRSG